VGAPASGDAAVDVAGPRIPHLRPLDGLRGVAVLAVVIFHFSPDVAPGGFLGVDVFFVLSGFLITSLLVTEHARTRHIHLRAFWVRRARRLFPALLLVLLAVGLYALLKADSFEVRSLRDDGLSALFYVANWRFIASGQSYIDQFLGLGPSPLRHTWSLAIEEQYYLVWPLVVGGLGVWVTRRRARGSMLALRPVIVVGCVVLAVASSVLMAVLHEPGADPSRVYYGTDTRAHLLLLGSALGAASAGLVAVAGVRLRQVVVVAGCIGAVGLGVLFATVDAQDTWLYRGGYFVFAVLIMVMIVAAGQPGRNPLAWVLGTRPLVGLGLISYGVYLWHWPIAVWVTGARTGLDGFALFALRSVLTLGVSLRATGWSSSRSGTARCESSARPSPGSSPRWPSSSPRWSSSCPCGSRATRRRCSPRPSSRGTRRSPPRPTRRRPDATRRPSRRRRRATASSRSRCTGTRSPTRSSPA
jgi:peptidoglycan/LPS O-acetylase OafA/YrhL